MYLLKIKTTENTWKNRIIVLFYLYSILKFFLGKFSLKNWSSRNWLKSGTDINCFIFVSNSMLFFLFFFHSYFLGQICSQNLKFSKLTEIWYKGTLLYVYHDFNIYFCKIVVLHNFLGKFGSSLVPNSLIVNSFSVSQYSNCYVQYGSWVTWKLENIFNY